MKSFKILYNSFRCYNRELAITTFPKLLQFRSKHVKFYQDNFKLFSLNLAIITYAINKMAKPNVDITYPPEKAVESDTENTTSRVTVERSEKPFQCSESDFQSIDQSEIHNHKLSHSVGIKLPTSTINTTSSDDIKTTKSSPTLKCEGMYTCPKCGYQCRSHKDLTYHMLSHTGEEPFICSLCDFKCTNRGSIKVHMLEHNDKLHLSCSTCENAHHLTQGGHISSLSDQPLRIVSVNVNLMPAGLLQFLTSGKSEDRALQLAEFLIKYHGNNTDIFYIQELYNADASQVFINKMEEAEFQPFAGPKAGTYDDSNYKFNSGQVIFINKKRLDVDLHMCNEDKILRTNMSNTDDKSITPEEQISDQIFKYTVTHLESLAFPSHGIHGKGALETNVPKGAIWLRLKVNNINENSELEEKILDTYYLHLQSDPLALLYNFTPQQVRREQIETIREYSVTNTENIKIPHHSLFIGDFNIDASWDEFKSLKELLNVTPVSEEKHVTIGSPTNTSHHPLIWKIGGLLYDHYEAQLDHCLISSSLKQLKSNNASKSPVAFGTFPLLIIKEGNREIGRATPPEEKISLTDHEGIFVELNF